MELTFINTQTGERYSRVRLTDGQLYGGTGTQEMIRDRMQRDDITVEEAMRSFDGWNNAYIRGELSDEVSGAV